MELRIPSSHQLGDRHRGGHDDVNPILDTRIYEVEFPDGEVLEYAANVIAENLYSSRWTRKVIIK
jgi:hypothetical protein